MGWVGLGEEKWTHVHLCCRLWAAGQPDNHGGHENCVNIWPNKNYEWNDANCNSTSCFVCENRNVNV